LTFESNPFSHKLKKAAVDRITDNLKIIVPINKNHFGDLKWKISQMLLFHFFKFTFKK